MRVNPELVEIDAGAVPRSKWQQPFDADLSDVFQVQTDIAEKVATALNVALGTQQRQQLAERPTDNLAAYDAFLRGEAVTQDMGVRDALRLRRGIALYTEAVTLDSTFALAWAQLSRAYALLYYTHDNSERRQPHADVARRAAERAQSLAPSHPDGRLAFGNYEILVRDNAQAARSAYVMGLTLAPDNVDLLTDLSLAEQVLGQWDSALVHVKRAQRLDPRSVSVARRLAVTLQALRHYREAAEAYDRALALAPTNLQLIQFKAILALEHGDLEGARAVLRAAETAVESTRLVAFIGGSVFEQSWILDSAQQRQLLAMDPGAFGDDRARWAMSRARMYWQRGDANRSRAYADIAARLLEERIGDTPDDGIAFSVLGQALSYAGRNGEAIRAGEHAAELVPLNRDIVNGANIRFALARLYVRAGQHAKAVDQLELLLKIPSMMSPGWLRIDPNFAPLHGNPRFDALIAQPVTGDDMPPTA